MKMLIKQPCRFSVDGITVRDWEPNEVANVPDQIAGMVESEGWGTPLAKALASPVAEPESEPEPDPQEELRSLRVTYHDVVGRRPGPQWDADTLRRKIAEAGQE